MTIVTLAVIVCYILDAQLPPVPAVGDDLNLHPMCLPFVVRAIATDLALGGRWYLSFRYLALRRRDDQQKQCRKTKS
jgi:hypothetical protein